MIVARRASDGRNCTLPPCRGRSAAVPAAHGWTSTAALPAVPAAHHPVPAPRAGPEARQMTHASAGDEVTSLHILPGPRAFLPGTTQLKHVAEVHQHPDPCSSGAAPSRSLRPPPLRGRGTAGAGCESPSPPTAWRCDVGATPLDRDGGELALHLGMTQVGIQQPVERPDHPFQLQWLQDTSLDQILEGRWGTCPDENTARSALPDEYFLLGCSDCGCPTGDGILLTKAPDRHPCSSKVRSGADQVIARVSELRAGVSRRLTATIFDTPCDRRLMPSSKPPPDWSSPTTTDAGLRVAMPGPSAGRRLAPSRLALAPPPPESRCLQNGI